MSDIIRAIISGGAVAVEAKDTKLYLEIETERHDLDLKHREEQVKLRDKSEARRTIKEYSDALKAIWSTSALIAGFSMITLNEIHWPDNLHTTLIITFSTLSATTICLEFCSMLLCTVAYVNVLSWTPRSEGNSEKDEFKKFFHSQCQSDFNFAVKAFKWGIYSFFMVLAQVGWFIFTEFGTTARYISGSMSMVAALVPFAYFYFYLSPTWYTATKDFGKLQNQYDPSGGAHQGAGGSP